MGAILVYRYGIIGRPPVPEVVSEQMELARQMRNALVEIEYGHDRAMQEMWAEHPAVGPIVARLEAAEVYIGELVQRARKEHSDDRTIKTRDDTATELRDTKAQIKALRAERRATIGEAYPQRKSQIEALRTDRKAAIKQCRQHYAAMGLYWATYNMVAADHATAVKAVEARRKRGLPAQLRIRYPDGTGTIAVQLQRADGDPPRTPEILASGIGKWRNILRLTPWIDPQVYDFAANRRQRAQRSGQVAFGVGTGQMIELPIRISRMIPPDADICEAQLTVSRTGGHRRMHLSVTAKVRDPDPPAGGPVIAIHFGWRRKPDGSVRVATWSTATELSVPDHLADNAVGHENARWGEIIIPAATIGIAARPAMLRSNRDLAMEPVQRKLAEWLDEHPQPGVDDRPGLTGTDVRRWRAPARFAALALRWRENPPDDDGAEEIVEILAAWRRQDRHLWEWESHERDQLTRRRDNAWRRVGAWLTSVAGLLLVDNTDLAGLRERTDDDTDPVLPGVAQRVARARAALSAPGRLRILITAAAQRHGVPVREVKTAYLTRTCPECAVVADPDPRYAASAVVVCPACGYAYDQDRSASKLMLDRERQGSAS